MQRKLDPARPTTPGSSGICLGEFVGACTRLGQMRVMEQNFDIPGASERSQHQRGINFHAQSPQPVGPGGIAGCELAELGAVVHRFHSAERPRIRQAAVAASDAKHQGRHLDAFTDHHTLLRARLGGLRVLGTFLEINRDWFRLRRFQPVGRGDLVFCVGYSWFSVGPRFRGSVPAMRARGCSLASHDRDPEQGIAAIRNDALFIDPQWRPGDAVVACPGHEVPILPTSGVMAEAVHGSVVSDNHTGPRTGT